MVNYGNYGKAKCYPNGGLYIEMIMLEVLADWIDGNGLVYVMTSANVTTEGRANGFQIGSHTSRGK